MPVVAVIGMPRVQESETRVVLLPLLDGGLKLHTVLLHSASKPLSIRTCSACRACYGCRRVMDALGKPVQGHQSATLLQKHAHMWCAFETIWCMPQGWIDSSSPSSGWDHSRAVNSAVQKPSPKAPHELRAPQEDQHNVHGALLLLHRCAVRGPGRTLTNAISFATMPRTSAGGCCARCADGSPGWAGPPAAMGIPSPAAESSAGGCEWFSAERSFSGSFPAFEVLGLKAESPSCHGVFTSCALSRGLALSLSSSWLPSWLAA